MTRLVKFSIFIACYAVFHMYVLKPNYFAGCVCTSKARLDGKTAIVTGANTGIGKETVVDLVRRGARVIMACRSLKKGEAAKKDVVERTGSNNVIVKHLDLASLSSVRAFAENINKNEGRLDILVNNAGVSNPKEFTKTEDGFEMMMGVNHFGHFLLTNLLVDLLKKSAPSRVVVVSSMGHREILGDSGLAVVEIGLHFDNINSEISYEGSSVYGKSKLANILFTKELARRLKGTGVTANSLHPGVFSSQLLLQHHKVYPLLLQYISKLFIRIFGKTVEEGAQTQIYLAVSEEVEGVTGLYFADCKETEPSKNAQDDVVAKKLWEVSAKLVGLNASEQVI